ncbi:hypothetical protein [Variovorax sp.]|uniref:hypothetical protein n=1 Tax=Variovorax sp. TaxID=1871043 RepID=UPI002D253F52|nr:hypothetical protein [Variovorax sp.]HYP86030.1 hypothetical protein [Variovorax sp.]
MFNLFTRNSHLRRAMALLEEAQMARLEHQAAAEHHAALARMYTDRAKRLEREIYGMGQEGPMTAPGKLVHEKPALYALDATRIEPKKS